MIVMRNAGDHQRDLLRYPGNYLAADKHAMTLNKKSILWPGYQFLKSYYALPEKLPEMRVPLQELHWPAARVPVFCSDPVVFPRHFPL
jgi:hypothetical protein